MSNPRKPHWVGLKWLLRYIDGTLRVDLVFKKGSNPLTLKEYVDSDFPGDKYQRTAYFFTFGDNCITWKLQLQPIVTVTSTEVECVVIAESVK